MSGTTAPDLNAIVARASQQYGVPAGIIDAVIQQESGGNPAAIGAAGEVGLMQLMPATAAGLGVNPYDVAGNVTGGTAYLAAMFQKFGNWTSALSAYNSGSPTSAAGQTYAGNVLALANQAGAGGAGTAGAGAGAGTTAGAPGNATTGTTAPASGMTFYVIAIILIVALVAFGIFGLIRG